MQSKETRRAGSTTELAECRANKSQPLIMDLPPLSIWSCMAIIVFAEQKYDIFIHLFIHVFFFNFIYLF